MSSENIGASLTLVPPDAMRAVITETGAALLVDAELPADQKKHAAEYLGAVLDRLDEREADPDEQILLTVGLVTQDNHSAVDPGRIISGTAEAVIGEHRKAVDAAWPATQEQRTLADVNTVVQYVRGQLEIGLRGQASKSE